MSRNILIVDHSATIRRILRTMIIGNINDAEVAEAENTTDAQAVLENDTIHLVLFSNESSSEQWLDFIDATKADAANERLNFVLFTSSPNEKVFSRANEAGVAGHLITPCTPATLTETINRTCNPTLLRESRRYNVPGATAVLQQGAVRREARVVNISLGGMLCEMTTPEAMNWSAPVTASISFPNGGDHRREAADIFAMVSSFFIQERAADHSPKLVRLALRFVNIPAEAETILQERLLRAEEEEKID